jgi:hypothetical protein
MRLTILIAAAAMALGAGCDRDEPARSSPSGSAPTTAPSSPSTSAPSSAPSASGGATTPTTPAPTGAPASQAERKDGANPVQGQVDPKQSEQHKDFQQKGDSAGPTSPDTKPKN